MMIYPIILYEQVENMIDRVHWHSGLVAYVCDDECVLTLVCDLRVRDDDACDPVVERPYDGDNLFTPIIIVSFMGYILVWMQ
jgi:hypothetical protein